MARLGFVECGYGWALCDLWMALWTECGIGLDEFAFHGISSMVYMILWLGPSIEIKRRMLKSLHRHILVNAFYDKIVAFLNKRRRMVWPPFTENMILYPAEQSIRIKLTYGHRNLSDIKQVCKCGEQLFPIRAVDGDDNRWTLLPKPSTNTSHLLATK